MEDKERKRLLAKHPYKVFQGKDGRWKTYIPDKSQESGRRLIAKSTKEKVEKVIIDLYATVEDKDYDKSLATLRDLFPEWINYKLLHTEQTSSIKRIKNDWDKYYSENYISDIPIYQFTKIQLDTWAHEYIKKERLTKKQYYNMTLIIRQILNYCVELDMIRKNLFNDVKIDSKKMFRKVPKPDDKTQVFYELECARLCRECMNRFERRDKITTPLAIVLNFQLGLRVGELVALKWSDINKGYIHISRMECAKFIVNKDGSVRRDGVEVVDHTKSLAGQRRIYLNEEAKKALEMIKKSNLKYGYFDEDYIFVSYLGTRLRAISVNSYLSDKCKYLNIDKSGNHKIRKTFISELFDERVNINEIRKIAGHEDERTTLRNYCYNTDGDENTEKKIELICKKIKKIE